MSGLGLFFCYEVPEEHISYQFISKLEVIKAQTREQVVAFIQKNITVKYVNNNQVARGGVACDIFTTEQLVALLDDYSEAIVGRYLKRRKSESRV